MKLRLIKQIWNERKSNSGLFIELFVVAIVIWFAVDLLYVRYTAMQQPLGYQIDNCFNLELGEVPKNSPHFDSTRVTTQNQDIQQLVERLKKEPGIEVVGLGENSFPCLFCSSYKHFRIDSLHPNSYVNCKQVSPSYFSLFKIQGENGESPSHLMEKLTPTTCLISDNLLMSEYNISGASLINRNMIFENDSSTMLSIKAVIRPMRFLKMESMRSGRTFLTYLSPKDYALDTQLGIRVSPSQAETIVVHLMRESQHRFKVGNVYLKSVDDYRSLEYAANLDSFKTYHLYMFGISFLLLNIFLGLLGIFWFRTRKRRNDIALKMALGATRKQIFKELIQEGLWLLFLSTLPAMMVNLNLAIAELNSRLEGVYLSSGRFVWTQIIAFLLMAIIIIVAIWIPAYQAMRIQPALALHEE